MELIEERREQQMKAKYEEGDKTKNINVIIVFFHLFPTSDPNGDLQWDFADML